MRLRYKKLDNKWINKNTIQSNETEYVVLIDESTETFTIKDQFNNIFTGNGDNLVSLKKNVRTALKSLGVHFEVEKRNHNKTVDTFDMDTHATLAAKAS